MFKSKEFNYIFDAQTILKINFKIISFIDFIT